MTGIDLDGDPSDSTNGMGIIPRAVASIFNRASELKTERAGAWQYSIKGSFIELYNEDLIDLLVDDSGVRRDVQIREDKEGHIIWGGLREVNVKNAQEVMKSVIFRLCAINFQEHSRFSPTVSFGRELLSVEQMKLT